MPVNIIGQFGLRLRLTSEVALVALRLFVCVVNTTQCEMFCYVHYTVWRNNDHLS